MIAKLLQIERFKSKLSKNGLRNREIEHNTTLHEDQDPYFTFLLFVYIM